jgi:hypothetical protein
MRRRPVEPLIQSRCSRGRPGGAHHDSLPRVMGVGTGDSRIGDGYDACRAEDTPAGNAQRSS